MRHVRCRHGTRLLPQQLSRHRGLILPVSCFVRLIKKGGLFQLSSSIKMITFDVLELRFLKRAELLWVFLRIANSDLFVKMEHRRRQEDNGNVKGHSFFFVGWHMCFKSLWCLVLF